MALLYDRQIIVDVAELTITDPRINFEIERQADETQTTGHVNVYNLSPEHEQRIIDRGEQITIQAGYPETLAQVFDGQVERVTRAREHLAKITRIKLGDMVRSAKRAKGLSGVTSRSYDGPVTVRQIVRDLAMDLGLPIGPLDAIPEDATETDWVWSGPTGSALRVVLKGVKCTWYEQDGVLRVNRVGMTQSDAPTIAVSPENGLIDAPIRTDEGAEARMFLNPAVVIGSRIELKSVLISGSWKVIGLRHAGDNWTGETI